MTHTLSAILRPLAIAGLAAAALSAPGVAAAQQTVRVASFTSDKATGVRDVIVPWMEAVEAEVGDLVDLQGFWGGSLGRDPFKQYDLVKSGVADVAWIVAGYAPGRFPQMHALELPFMAQNGVEASLFGWKMVSEGMVDGVDEFKVITVWSPSGDHVHMAGEVIDSVDDIEGKRIRTASSAQAAFVEGLGGVPQTIGAVEVNDALSRGSVNGLVQAYTGMRTFGTFDVVDSTYEIPLGNTPFLLLMNKDTWESLPAEVQAAMDKHGGATLAEIGGAAYDKANREIREAKLGDADYTITTPSQEELTALRERFEALHMEWVAATNNGQAVYDAFLSFLEDHRASGS